MAISLKEKQLVKYKSLMSKVPNEYKGSADIRAKICATCRYMHDTTLECIKCDCSFKKEFYLKGKRCPERMW